MRIVLPCIFVFSLWILPFILARRGWSSPAIGYTVAAICMFIVIIIGGDPEVRTIRIPEPSILMVRWVGGTLLTGTILTGIIALVRKISSRSRRSQPLQD